MTGRRYGALVAIRRVGSKPNGNAIWLCRCDCGNECEVDGYDVRRHKTISCKECGAERSRQGSVKHGLSHTREFATWTDMHTRCYNPNSTGFSGYGGRGISICDRWRESFANFLADMGPKPSRSHSIERDDVNGNYEPGNCRWATAKEQANNKRSNRLVTIDGVTMNVSEWSVASGVSKTCIFLRLKAGEEGVALLRPSKRLGCVTHEGITDTYEGWSKRTGIKPSTIAMRISNCGWSIADALSKGAKL